MLESCTKLSGRSGKKEISSFFEAVLAMQESSLADKYSHVPACGPSACPQPWLLGLAVEWEPQHCSPWDTFSLVQGSRCVSSFGQVLTSSSGSMLRGWVPDCLAPICRLMKTA